jgi:Cu/Ag efflux protein CusF
LLVTVSAGDEKGSSNGGNRFMKVTRFTFTLLFLGTVSMTALAQESATEGNVVELTARIQAIDRDARLVTLEDEDGNVETIYAGPQVKRFDELKVGDRVSFRFYESLVSQIRKAGEAAPPKTEGGPTLVRGKGPKPGGTVSRQLSATVTIKAVDPTVPRLTVTTEEGRTMSFKVEDKKLIEGVKVGDHVDITYTAALMIAVK